MFFPLNTFSNSAAKFKSWFRKTNTACDYYCCVLVRYVTPLCDAWIEGNGPDGGETNETPGNSYTPRYEYYSVSFKGIIRIICILLYNNISTM